VRRRDCAAPLRGEASNRPRSDGLRLGAQENNLFEGTAARKARGAKQATSGLNWRSAAPHFTGKFNMGILSKSGTATLCYIHGNHHWLIR
jgi:hypothetical protein